MTDTKPIRGIAVIGTGVMEPSGTSLFLAKELHVVATDVAPKAETARAAVELSSEPPTLSRNTAGTWIVLTVLSLLLVAAGVVACIGWSLGGAYVPTSGYIAMGFGVIFSLLVGFGLMALLFYSSRKGYDEPAVLIEDSRVDRDDRLDFGH